MQEKIVTTAQRDIDFNVGPFSGEQRGLVSLSVTSKAQWTVIDPTNLAQSIVNSANEIVQTSTTAQNMWSNFQETVKIYKQGKAYYDGAPV